MGEGASSAWAQGGIAAAVAEGDTTEAHARDTVAAGAGLVDEALAAAMCAEAPARVHDLLAYGVPFDKDLAGRLAVGREAAHSARRIVHVKGDLAGHAIMAALIATVRSTPSITVLEGYTAEDLTTDGTRVTGVRAQHGNRVLTLPTRAVVLASGGIGHLYLVTTNPPQASGTGLAIAARAGAVLADTEFVQFHPTASCAPSIRMPSSHRATSWRAACSPRSRPDAAPSSTHVPPSGRRSPSTSRPSTGVA
jgi:L-aspartate oxidase